MTIAATNMELKSIFLPAFKEELIVYHSDDEIPTLAMGGYSVGDLYTSIIITCVVHVMCS